MSWHWYILVAAVRLLFLWVPCLLDAKGKKDEFALANGTLDEAREFANANNCRSILVSFPLVIFITVLSAANRAYPTGIDAFMVCVYIFIGGIMAFAGYRINLKHFRGERVPFLWLSVVIIIEILTSIFALDFLVNRLQP
jgi:hypothetical protein